MPWHGLVDWCFEPKDNDMKKTILLLGFGIASTLSASAQWVTVGPEIGINSTSFVERYNGVDVSDGMRPGLKVGGIIDIGFTRHFSLQPGLYYNMKGAQERYSNTFTTENGSLRTDEVRNDFRINYVELPVNFQFKFGQARNGQFFFGAGPYISLALSGTITNANGTSIILPSGRMLTAENQHSTSARIGTTLTDDITPLDGGLNLNLGYISPMGIFVRGNMGLGVANILPEGDANNYIRNWGMGVSVGYLFNH